MFRKAAASLPLDSSDKASVDISSLRGSGVFQQPDNEATLTMLERSVFPFLLIQNAGLPGDLKKDLKSRLFRWGKFFMLPDS